MGTQEVLTQKVRPLCDGSLITVGRSIEGMHIDFCVITFHKTDILNGQGDRFTVTSESQSAALFILRGRVALIGGAAGLFLGIMQICDIMQEVEVATPVLAGGIKVVTIAPIYSLIVYFLSIIIRIVQTPRI